MLKIETIRDLQSMLTSERVTYKGNEVLRVHQILTELEVEANAQMVASRVTPTPETIDGQH